MTDDIWQTRKQQASTWFAELRDTITGQFEKMEDDLVGGNKADMPSGRFAITPWARNDDAANHSGSVLGGGGEMAVMRGRVFEKVGVNISIVEGIFSEEYRAHIPGAQEDGHFWAAGISLVAHMQSPLVPAVHMNTRMIVTSQKGWFGGGMDLTPMIENETDTHDWHAGIKECCDRHTPDAYQKYKKWCDEYFFLPHRNEARGVGGIFYDYLEEDWDKDFAFTQDVGKTFADLYPGIARRHMNESWSEEQREAQLIKRGRYVEFNLLYDRGTAFGLKTGGNTDAILMSLPPAVKWP